MRDAVHDDDVGFRRLGVYAELLSEHSAVGALDWDEPEQPAWISFDDESHPPGAEHADAVEQDRPVVDVFGWQRTPLLSHRCSPANDEFGSQLKDPRAACHEARCHRSPPIS